MKCKGCKWQSHGKVSSGDAVVYCIGSPDHEPKNGSEKFIDQNRIIETGYDDIPLYRANDNDECHLWHSERFELTQKAEE